VAAAVVPHTRADHPAPAGHPAHLAQARHRVGHEVHDKLGEDGVERPVREREPFGRRDADRHPRQPLPGRHGEGLRGIDRADLAGAQPARQLRRQRAGPAANVQRPLPGPLPGPDPGQIGEHRR
jgi:hypothetical protein